MASGRRAQRLVARCSLQSQPEQIKSMSDTRTRSILQRLPVILAVTAASYGLAYPQPARAGTTGAANSQPSKQAAKSPALRAPQR
jgi:hypothetical protein